MSETPRRGVGIAERGRRQAKKTHREHAAKLAAAQREIEGEVADGSRKSGRVTIQHLLERAGLGPTYLEKKSRGDLKLSIAKWIRATNDELLAAGKPSGVPVLGSAASHDLHQILSKYAALDYKSRHQDREISRLKVQIKLLEDQNDRFRQMLDGNELPSQRIY